MVKVLFFGTPEISVPFLKWLVGNTTVLGAVSRPDEPVGRGMEITAPPVKKFAVEKNIPVFQPSGKWTDEIIAPLKKLNADIGIVVAYGRIMPETVYMIPKLGCINIHFSLLPKYRGAAPMQWALINGETKTGVSAFWLDAGMDSGPVFHQKEIAIDPADDAKSLKEKLVKLGIEVLEQVIKDIDASRIVRKPQQGQVVMAPLLKKETGHIDWMMPADKIVNLTRGVLEWPGATASLAGKKLKIIRAVGIGLRSGLPPSGANASHSPDTDRPHKLPGTIIEAIKDKGIVVQAGDGRVLLLEVQPEGKKPMPAWAFWQGARLKIGDKFE